MKKLTTAACAELLIAKVFCNHGILEEIAFDRDKLFTGTIWNILLLVEDILLIDYFDCLFC